MQCMFTLYSIKETFLVSQWDTLIYHRVRGKTPNISQWRRAGFNLIICSVKRRRRFIVTLFFIRLTHSHYYPDHEVQLMWDEITYPIPNCIGFTVEVWEWISNFTQNVLDMWLLIKAVNKTSSMSQLLYFSNRIPNRPATSTNAPFKMHPL